MAEMFHPGQRWVSETEPELGIGAVQRVTSRTVALRFGATNETREYARDNAPLRRVKFRTGDAIKTHEGVTFAVDAVREANGLLFYQSAETELCETELSDAISFSKPEERLLAGQVDEPELFDLRLKALNQQHRRKKSKVRGFVGGRIELIPHQLYVSSEIAGRLLPRVLLADEVGLGKTIEACLILHRLIQTGRVHRALILVPETLIHQWFVELLRRFNLWFHIFDEERCASIEGANPDANPFLDDQLVLSSVALLRNERRFTQALAAGWDILVVDEAHHLGWSAEAPSQEYKIVEAIGAKTPGLLLLTATPEQLGIASHFARLRLLDPNRFHDLNEFVNEAEGYREVALISDKLISSKSLAPAEVSNLARILGQSEATLRSTLISNDAGRQELIRSLLDRHGTGRVMFRNTRATISGFPKRNAQLHALSATEDDPELFDRLADEFSGDTGNDENFQPEFSDDPRILWLAELLRSLKTEKVLLICRTRKKVEAIDSALRQQINIKIGLFHEGLPLVQRDRNAAWFADDDGARILICSEIGSEGRNFQFSHHLVLFDLPLDPELLEQRIGRLDRIGQKSEIQVHVPYIIGSSHEVLARWFHEGLYSFEKNLSGGRELLERFGERVKDLAQDFHEMEKTARPELVRLIAETAEARKNLTTKLEQGRDRLLEMSSFKPDLASRLVQEIRQEDQDIALDGFMLSVFDHFTIHVEELAPRTYFLGSAGVFADSFPGLPAEGLSVTSDRLRALSREDMQFLSWDHPLVTSALDLILGSEKGNSSFAKWTDTKAAGLYLETVYVLECIAPPHLHVDRFLPPTPVRVVVDHRGSDVSSTVTTEILSRNVKVADAYPLLDQAEVREDLLPELISQALKIASVRVPTIVAEARKEMSARLNQESTRLKELQKINPSVRQEEIDLLTQHQKALDSHLSEARLRVDAVRLVQRGPR